MIIAKVSPLISKASSVLAGVSTQVRGIVTVLTWELLFHLAVMCGGTVLQPGGKLCLWPLPLFVDDWYKLTGITFFTPPSPRYSLLRMRTCYLRRDSCLPHIHLWVISCVVPCLCKVVTWFYQCSSLSVRCIELHILHCSWARRCLPQHHHHKQ